MKTCKECVWSNKMWVRAKITPSKQLDQPGGTIFTCDLMPPASRILIDFEVCSEYKAKETY